MRFEIVAALVLGVLLPFLETLRRGIGHWMVDFTTMFEDYLGGAVLLIASWAALSGRRWGTLLMVVAWTALSGMMSISLVSQLEDTIRGTGVEPHNVVVVVVKLLLWFTCVVSLVLSFRRVLSSLPSSELK